MAYNKTPFKMKGKSPMMKALVGKQNNLPDALKEKILASPAKQTEEGKAQDKISKIAKDDATSYRAKQRKTQRQVKKVDKAVEQPSRRKDRMQRAKTLLEREGVKSPAPVKQMSKLKKSSPAKQGDVELRDLPDMAVQGAKKLVKKIGSIKLSTKEGKARREAKRALRKEQKAKKLEAKAKKLKKNSPATKKNCGYKK